MGGRSRTFARDCAILKLACSSWSVLFCLKIPPSVLFLRPNPSRTRPSHSRKFTGGGGVRGSIRTTDESTLGGGRKLFLPTCTKQIARYWVPDCDFSYPKAWRVQHSPSSHLEEVVDPRQQLRVDGEPAVQRVAWLGDKAHGKFVLEHDDGCAERGFVRKQFERERRRYLVRDVGHAHVKVRQLDLHDVPVDDLQVLLVRGALHAALQLQHLHACPAKVVEQHAMARAA